MNYYFHVRNEEDKIRLCFSEIALDKFDENIIHLVRMLWPALHSVEQFHLKYPDELNSIELIQSFVDNIQRHIKAISPKLIAPYMRLNISLDYINKNGELIGLKKSSKFNDPDPVVLLEPKLLDKSDETAAILCYEVTKYILTFNDLSDLNHEIVESGIFVLGLGNIFLNGFRNIKKRNVTGYPFYYNDDIYGQMNARSHYLWLSRYRLS